MVREGGHGEGVKALRLQPALNTPSNHNSLILICTDAILECVCLNISCTVHTPGPHHTRGLSYLEPTPQKGWKNTGGKV